jgi:malate dehydrogenase (oxaloacetate-decarboxylating)(NADP+)
VYEGRNLEFGREYIIPTPFDDRLILNLSIAVAKAAMESGVARQPIADFDKYREELKARHNKYSTRSL